MVLHDSSQICLKMAKFTNHIIYGYPFRPCHIDMLIFQLFFKNREWNADWCICQCRCGRSCRSARLQVYVYGVPPVRTRFAVHGSVVMVLRVLCSFLMYSQFPCYSKENITYKYKVNDQYNPNALSNGAFSFLDSNILGIMY